MEASVSFHHKSFTQIIHSKQQQIEVPLINVFFMLVPVLNAPESAYYCKKTTAKKKSQFLGKLTVATKAIPLAQLFYRGLQRALNASLEDSHQDYNATLTMSEEIQLELIWWEHHLQEWNGKSMMTHRPSLTIESDPSKKGWGAVCSGQRTGGPWSTKERSWHLEAWAVFLAVKSFARDRQGITILLKIDNMTSVAYINNLGGTVSPNMNRIVKELWRDIHLQAEHLAGVLNTIADEESRVMKDRSDWMLDQRVSKLSKHERVHCPSIYLHRD